MEKKGEPVDIFNGNVNSKTKGKTKLECETLFQSKKKRLIKKLFFHII